MSSSHNCEPHNCKPHDCKPDWKAYALGELDANARRQAEVCAAACPVCREELATVRLTLDALSTLREEEIPQRIAFVSDKVFEPRWWQKALRSFQQPSFAAAAVIAVAILVHGFVRPMGPAVGSSINPAVDSSAVQAQVAALAEKEISARVEAAVNVAVAKAVADTDQREAERTEELLAAAEKRYAAQRREDFATAAANYEMLRKQVVQMYAVNTGAGVR